MNFENPVLVSWSQIFVLKIGFLPEFWPVFFSGIPVRIVTVIMVNITYFWLEFWLEL